MPNTSSPKVVTAAADAISASVWDGGEFIVLDAPDGAVWSANGEHSITVGGYGEFETDSKGRLYQIQRRHLWGEALNLINMGAYDCPAGCTTADDCPDWVA